LLTGALLVALGALFSRIIANRKVPRCLSKRLDILVACKTLCCMIYIAGTVAMLVCAEKETSEWVLLSAGVATAASP
jgi:uncharacterized membrane protein